MLVAISILLLILDLLIEIISNAWFVVLMRYSSSSNLYGENMYLDEIKREICV